uniref:Uncharacterized protein n=1 Tax=Myoviridae sp. ctCo31 TaxID=2825053 RepID=A0A8S5UMA0_9CAUD|nr:MAG TPA: hypothetical protein [Myoviridae sp. ctCo31]
MILSLSKVRILFPFTFRSIPSFLNKISLEFCLPAKVV